MNLKEAIEKRKFDKDFPPTLREYLLANAQAFFFEKLRDFEQKLDRLKEDFVEEMETKVKEMASTVLTSRFEAQLKGEKGDKPVPGVDYPIPKDGKTPTDNELQALILPLIPPPIPGETPTTQGLLKLIRPLIPKVKNGETPSDEKLLSLIRPLIPKVEEVLLDSPEEVVEKVNNADTKVKKSAIEGLEEEIRVIKSNIQQKKGSGGGMGNVQQESKSVSSATTTITTTYKIAGGVAVWITYQGQGLSYGTHYTVGGDKKTITLLFTPGDQTTIDVVYIRS